MSNSVLIRALGPAILCISVAAGQQTPAPPPTAPAPTAPAPTAPAPTPTTPTAPSNVSFGTPQTTTVPRPPTPIYVTGTVTLPDGSEPPETVQIERMCSANQVRSEGYTDRRGRFSLQLGQSQQIIPDASQIMMTDGTQGFNTNRNGGTGSSATPNGAEYFDCELRARLAGYRSSSILLAGRRAMDNPNVGIIVIYPIGDMEGQAISATAANAPKEARKAYEKGLSQRKKLKLEDAERNFRKAVELHPKFADAWLELGRSLFSRQRYKEARDAFVRATEADSRYVYPYEEWYRTAFELTNWEELEQATAKLVALNPYEFPAAYYYNGVANYQLEQFDAATRSLDQALKAAPAKVNPKIFYVQGLVFVRQRQYARAAESFLEFKDRAPLDPTIPKVQAILAEIDRMQN